MEYSIRVEWPKLHAAVRAVDEARAGSWIGRDGHFDAFGGSYYPSSYESLTGLVRICSAVGKIRQDTWDVVHAHKSVEDVRRACRVALALDDVHRILSETGLIARDSNIICGISEGVIGLTGLCWLCGMERDNREVPVGAVRAFSVGGSLEDLRSALEAAPIRQEQD